MSGTEPGGRPDQQSVPEAVHAVLARSTPLPLPGAGQTRARWLRLSAVAREDVVVGRLVEAHADADAILHEITGSRVGAGQWWGVWAAEPPTPRLDAERNGTSWLLTGAKAWCSGAGMCSHALVTAHDGDERRLFAVDLGQPGVLVGQGGWQARGMQRSATEQVAFDAVSATLVGSGEAYLSRAGFWHGSAGVAACWLGGAEAVADTLRTAAARRRLDDHARAHLGAVDAALAGSRWTLLGAADEVDADPADITGARVRALRVRAVVEAAASLVLDRVGRALGPGPLAQDARHAAAVADLGIYLRQSHAERDLATLGAMAVPPPDVSA